MDRRTFVDLTLATTANSLLPRIAFAQTAPKAKNVVPTTAGVTAMNTPTSDKSISALLVVDPYNDFISEGGKIWPRIKAVAEANDCVSNMLKVLNAARAVKLRVFYAMHHRYRAGDYETWPTLRRFNEPRGSTRASNTAHGVASSVPNSCRRRVRLSHRNTGVPVASPTPTWTCNSRSTASKLIVIGLIAHTCIEATVRYAAELGYDVTVVKD